MIPDLPLYINVLFIVTTFITVYLFYKASGKNTVVLVLLLAWIAIQTVTGLTKFYVVTNTIPPRFVLLVGLPLFTIIFLFATPASRRFIDSLNPRWLTLLHTVRIPVEIVLFLLFTQGYVPKLMTFEGRNFDILSGITAPIIAWAGYFRGGLSKPVLILWNVVCLALLFNIVIHAILSAPFPFQQFAFDQPNVALLYFPFVWLPCCIVPLVLLSHLACIRQVLKRE